MWKGDVERTNDGGGAKDEDVCYDAYNTVPEDALAFEGFVAHRVCVYLCVIVHRSRRESSRS
jgi:hypothetical protein